MNQVGRCSIRKLPVSSQSWQGWHHWVVLLVTHGESASCFIRLQIIWEKTCFWWKILSVQNILVVFIWQNCTLKKLFLQWDFYYFHIGHLRRIFYHFMVAATNIFFSCFDWMFFSNLTFDGCKPVTHLMI